MPSYQLVWRWTTLHGHAGCEEHDINPGGTNACEWPVHEPDTISREQYVVRSHVEVQQSVAGDQWRSSLLEGDESVEMTSRPPVKVGDMGWLLVTEASPATEVARERLASRT